MQDELKKFNKLMVHPNFRKTIMDINRLNISLPSLPIQENFDFNLYAFPKEGVLVSNIEKNHSYPLDAIKGQELLKKITISAYDESINKFASLEGNAFLTSHSLIIQGTDDYIPSSYLTFYFYTRSEDYTKNSDFIKYSVEPETDSKKDYVNDRNEFIGENAPNNSLLLIDGPLIGGQMTSYTLKLNQKLLLKNIIPIFFVKNSTGSLIIDNIKELKGKFNSDLHWVYKFLKNGERTCFYQYQDTYVKNNSKIFCYLKAFDVSPIRVEMHTTTFDKYKGIIQELMNLLFYLLLVQGDKSNPQIRPIAIAEKYARESLKLINLDHLMKSLGIMATINQERFGWG